MGNRSGVCYNMCMPIARTPVSAEHVYMCSCIYAHSSNCLKLCTGGTVAASFTAAFVHAKVDEIISQFKRCLNCACTPTGPVCVPQPASLCDDEPGVVYSV